MRRLLRIKSSETEDTNIDIDTGSLSEYPLSLLEELYEEILNEIEKRKYNLIQVTWKGEWSGKIDEKKPYLAILAPREGEDSPNPPLKRYFKYDFRFLPLSKDGNIFTFVGRLKIGEILRGRVLIDRNFYYRVSEKGLCIISESEARKFLSKRQSG